MESEGLRRLKKVADFMMTHATGHYEDCPECNGEGGHSYVHDMCGGQGCPFCNLGMVFEPCKNPDCERGQVWVSDDEPYDCPVHGKIGINGECPLC